VDNLAISEGRPFINLSAVTIFRFQFLHPTSQCERGE